ncbi:MAG TPA: type II secretion system minor pseudopilin GspJ [Allosphingosinicella sp.]|nr:type II secretion system minor pseudopilin GspJ [Allosphingosinicella sp.]
MPAPVNRENYILSPFTSGFTLVEMLIALAIFGMITAAGVALLSLTVRTQESAERLLDAQGALRRTGALLGADLGQAAPRIHRDRDGRPLPAFTGNEGGDPVLLGLVRRGFEDESAFRSSLQRVEYRLREGRLERWRYDAVDGEGRATATTLLEDVRRVRLRYRDREGNWRARWDPTDPARLPAAVEMVSDSAGQGEVRMLFLVGGGR